MRPFTTLALFAAALAGTAAHAQYGDGYAGYGGYAGPAPQGAPGSYVQPGYGSYAGGYGYPDPAFAGGYGGQPGYYAGGQDVATAPAYRSGWYDRRPMPAYSDDERWSGGDFYGTAEARDDDDLDLQAARTRPVTQPTRYPGEDERIGAALDARDAQRAASEATLRARAQAPQTASYADRVARWRAQADACEAGDVSACRAR